MLPQGRKSCHFVFGTIQKFYDRYDRNIFLLTICGTEGENFSYVNPKVSW